MTQGSENRREVGGRGRDIACSLVLGTVLGATSAASLATVGVREIAILGDSVHQGPIVACAALAILIASALACYLLLRNCSRLLTWADRKDPLKVFSLELGRKDVAIAAALIFVCWIPWMILQYPVAMNGDTYNQLYQFQTSSPTYYSTEGVMVDASYVDHHPVFDTLLFGAFLSLGDLVGSQNGGLFAYSLFQSALLAVGLALSCCYMEKLGVPKLFRLVSVAFCALFPPMPLWAACMVKDSVNAAVFVYFSLMVVEAVRSRGEAFSSRSFTIAFIALACLCILTKKSGALVTVVATVALMLYLRDRWLALVAGLAVPLAVSFAFMPLVVYPAIGGVAPGGVQEAFGFALQQVVTAVNEEDDLSGQEREAVGRVLDLERAVERYKPAIADPVKNSAHDDATRSDYLTFIPAYLSIGARHPLAYTASVFQIAGTLVTPGRTFTYFSTPDQEESWVEKFAEHDVNGELNLTFDKPEPIAGVAAGFEDFWRSVIPKLGPLQVFFNTGFYGGWIPMICLVICLFADRRYAVALVPQLCVIAIVLMSPASSVRYVLPLLYTAPLMLAVLCASLRTRCSQGEGGLADGR